MPKDVLDLTLTAVSYSPVMKNRQDKVDYWSDTELAKDLPEKVAWRFTNYLRRCLDGREKTYREIRFKDTTGRFLKEKLTTMMAAPLGGKNKQRNDITLELADALCKEMQSTARPAPGAIFIIQGEWSGKSYIAIVKLDLTPLEVIELRVKEDAHELLFNAIDRALPGQDSGFRKGVVFPSPGAGHARSGQHDTDALYWDRFVGAELYRDAEAATKTIVDVAQKIAQENGTEISAPEMVKMTAELSTLDATDTTEVAKAVDKATGRRKKLATIVERLKEATGAGGIPRVAPLVRVLFKMRDALVFPVPSAMVESGDVVVEQKGKNVVITVKDSEFAYDTVVGKDRR